MSITIQQQGRRLYLRGGGTYSARDQIRAAGGKWDADERAWYVGVQRREVAEQIIAQIGAAPPAPREDAAQGDDTTVAGRARYRGHTYYLAARIIRGRTPFDDEVTAISTRDGASLLLVFRDGTRSCWAPRDAVEVLATYQRARTIGSLRAYAASARGAHPDDCECRPCLAATLEGLDDMDDFAGAADFAAEHGLRY